ncbi:pilus assembly protein CpaF [Motilibacter rhizosphaerae]|uniref:Pilus assembly protein CpaF n=1 Tax=Motilibacter rhizosphaerae TaxID=598652 RepID=A0A4Q7NAC1_9ACTN|nr:TadA family conjugal transfer-associated ATPase [Motilibacter rhizosphaerae]RZS79388.1 pilus assembly protein CpaF [Motilibacter rhizosphaerae]
MSGAAAALDARVLAAVRRRLAEDGGEPEALAVADLVRAEAPCPLSSSAVLAAVGTLQAELSGAGPLEPLLADPEVTDVLVNAGGEVWVDRGHGLVRSAVRFGDEGQVRRLAVRLAARCGRRLDDAAPWVDARLPGGVRLHAVVPPVAVGGTHLSLRVLRQQHRSLDELVEDGSVDPGAAELLHSLVAARASFLVTGGTGSGKTTLLACLLGLVPDDERLVVAEDTTELAPRHPHALSLEGRPSNAEGRGAVPLRELVRQALRMRPDRLVVGEVRGAEVVELLAALNTGHEGSCGTLHARSPGAVPARIAALAAPAGMDAAATASQLLAGLDAVVHVERTREGRRVSSLGVLEPDAAGGCTVSTAWTPAGRGPGWPRLAALLERQGT